MPITPAPPESRSRWEPILRLLAMGVGGFAMLAALGAAMWGFVGGAVGGGLGPVASAGIAVLLFLLVHALSTVPFLVAHQLVLGNIRWAAGVALTSLLVGLITLTVNDLAVLGRIAAVIAGILLAATALVAVRRPHHPT